MSSETESERDGGSSVAAMTAGMAAKLACSGVFLSGRGLAEVVAEDIRPLTPLAGDLEFKLDRAAGVVVARLHGASATALFRPGVGATLAVDGDLPALIRQADGLDLARRRGPRGFEAAPARDPAALERALDAAFAEAPARPGKQTRAVVVLQDGRLVAERYAPGFSPDTPMLGWSASKSVLGALVGALVDDGRLALDAPVLAPEWAAPDDPRREITVDHLLRMSSGLAFDEPYVPGSDSTTMLFERGDMAAYAAAKPLAAPPGRVWSYASGTTNLLSRTALLAAGGTMAACQKYAWERLFEPAGMTSAVFEPDARGVMVGSSYFYATARDWARFGQLHLDDGVSEGRRVLSRAWIDHVRAPAPAAPLGEYGGHFRLNGRAVPGSPARAFPDLPADMYFARGFGLQVVAVFPARRAVIVRLGWTLDDDAFDMNREFADLLASLEPARAAGVEKAS